MLLAGTSGTHSVCVCTLHQNVKLMLEGCKFLSNEDLKVMLISDHAGPITYYHILDCMTRNPGTPDCFLENCQKCSNYEEFGQQLIALMERFLIDEVNFKVWINVDRTTLETLTKSSDKFIELLSEKLHLLKRHDFVAKQQAMFLKKAKANLLPERWLS